MDRKDAVVYIVDDDEAVRDSLSLLVSSIGLRVRALPAATDFLGAYDASRPCVLVLDIRMPGMSGIELQEHLIENDSLIPIIFITGHGDVQMAVEAMKSGAVDFIQKPFRDQDLLDRINQALDEELKERDERVTQQEIRRRVETLTPREKEVLGLVVQGKANKVIAIDLGVSQRTVEIHRSRVMEKMKARSLAQLVRMMTAIGQ